MAKFQKRVQLWDMTPEQRAELQPGQYVKAGESRGRWIGETLTSSVAMWHAPQGQHMEKFRALRAYAKGRGAT